MLAALKLTLEQRERRLRMMDQAFPEAMVRIPKGLAREGTVPARRAEEAVRDLQDLRITRYPHFLLLPEIWQRRNNLAWWAERQGKRG